MFKIVLYQPEIPPNTGNIMRLCANTGCELHLIRPLGFSISDRQLERAGMDYRERATHTIHDDWETCMAKLGDGQRYAITTRGTTPCHETRFAPGDILIFGPETRGLPETLLADFDRTHRLRIPMIAESRSLNLANAVAVVTYEAWRQCGFTTPATPS